MWSRSAFLLFLWLATSAFEAAAWDSGRVERFATLPSGAANPAGIAVDQHGDFYVTTFAVTGTPPGRLFVFDDHGRLKRALAVESSSSLLLGAAFHPLTHELLVVDFDAGQVLRVDPHSGASSVFAAGFPLFGADGLFDEIVVVDRTGRAIAKLGDFDGLRGGAPRGLLFPASMARQGEWLYVTNLSLDLRLFGLPPSVDAQWAGEVTSHTISRIRARIPRRDRDDD